MTVRATKTGKPKNLSFCFVHYSTKPRSACCNPILTNSTKLVCIYSIDKHPNIEEKGSDIEEDTKPSPEGGKPVNNSSTKERTLISKAQIAGIAEGVKMPRRFKSAFIIYSSMRHSQIKKELASKGFAKKVMIGLARSR